MAKLERRINPRPTHADNLVRPGNPRHPPSLATASILLNDSLMKPTPSRRQKSAAGFTRLELLVVVVALALLGGVLRPVWGNSGPTRSLVCMDNLRRLQAAWLLYAEDNQGWLPGNYHGGFVPNSSGREHPWATGWLDWSNHSENTNTVYLTDPRRACLAPFLGGDVSLYKCPADDYLSFTQVKAGWTSRARSYAMNCYLGEGNQPTGPFDSGYPIVRRLAEFGSLPPQQTFVFTEEHPESINDPLLFVSMNEWRWTDLPGSFHDGSAWFTFADGHLERRSWENPRTVVPVRFMSWTFTSVQPDDPDLTWVRAHTTAR